MRKLQRSLSLLLTVVMMFTAVFFIPDFSYHSYAEELDTTDNINDVEADEDMDSPDELSNPDDNDSSFLEDDADELIETENLLGVNGEDSWGYDLNRQGTKLSVTSYVNGSVTATFSESLLRYKESYVFCYDPGKRFKPSDNVSEHYGAPEELSDEQAKTVSLIIFYAWNNYSIAGPDGTVNYYLIQCTIWNYLNDVNPGFTPYKLYITDESLVSHARQDSFLQECLDWAHEHWNDYNTWMTYWINEDGANYQPVLWGWASPVEKGSLSVHKSSLHPENTDGNTYYSLAGAVYGVYGTYSDAESYSNCITTITTDSSGNGSSSELDYGTYYVRELTASPGFELDTNIYEKTVNGSDSQPSVSSVEPDNGGKIKVVKTSGNKTVTDGNGCYSLDGAVYGIYKTRNDAQNNTNVYKTITTNSNGRGISEKLPFGKYYVKEIMPSKGYQLDYNIYEKTVDVKDEEEEVSSLEPPEGDPSEIVLTKRDSDYNEPIKGAVYEIKYYAAETKEQISNATYKRHWYLMTDSDGEAIMDDAYIVSFNGNNSDEFYYNGAGDPILPLGYISIQEVQAPEEFVLVDTVSYYKVDNNMLKDVNTNAVAHPEVKEPYKKQPFQIMKVADDGTSELTPLSNAGFMACRLDELDTDSEGNYIFDVSKAVVLSKDGNKEMFTDNDGFAESAELRYGTYVVRETTVPRGYLPVADFMVTVNKDSRTPQKIRYMSDTQQRFYLKITKVDKNTNNTILNNKSSYKVWSYDNNKYLSFRTYTGSRFEMVDTFETAEDGILITPGTLPYGRYRIDEVVAPEGYNIDKPVDFVIDENTVYETYSVEGDIAIGVVPIVYKDEEIYGRLELEKIGQDRVYDEDTNEFVFNDVPLENIRFGVYADEDIFAADGSGNIVYEKGDLAFELLTDSKGEAYCDNIPLGKYVVKELNTPDDYITAQDIIIEFSLDEKKPDDNGNYYVEQKTEFYNASYYPKVMTTALDSKTKEHSGVVGTNATVVDKVDCTDLVIGREYNIKGILYDTTTGKPYVDNEGKFVTAEKTFTSTDKNQSVYLEFTYDTTDLAGETITVFETMYYNNKVVALHADISDTEQQVHYPNVKTTALDKETTDDVGVVDDKVTVIDKVSCTNLIVGKEYTIKGKLYNTETGGAVLENGKEVTSTKTFKAEEVNPVIELEFTLDSKTLAGETIVVFEDLYHNDIKVATHSDLTDENQQVHYPSVGTKAVDKDTDSKSGVTGEKATIVDTVSCKNLVVGKTYTVKGKLYDTETGEVFLDNGKEVTTEKKFIAVKKNLEIELEFAFDSSSLEGKTTTVFEDLYHNDVKVASHSVLEDKDQQVDYPKVRTTAKDKATDTHTGLRSDEVTIVDAVSCMNLIIGKEYTVKGKLYNTETGEVFLDNGKEVTAEKTFKADKKDMTVELEFSFDSMSLEGETVVVFEDLYFKNIKVDSHARLDDKDQQVHYPKINTTAKNAVDGGKEAKPKKAVTINDTVDIKSIGVGEKFVVRGVIYDKATKEKVIINDAEVTSYAEFVSQDSDMKIDVIFTFDATSLVGKDIVVFEYLYIVSEDGSEVLVTSHEDINDIGQTIRFSSEPKTGDTRPIATVMVIMIVSVFLLLSLALCKKWLRSKM